MNILWNQNESISLRNSHKDGFQCPLYRHSSDAPPYTLSFGYLLSGNVNCCQTRFDEYPIRYSSVVKPINHQKANEAIKTIRKTMKNTGKSYRYSIPTVPFCYNPLMNNCNQNQMSTMAGLLAGAAETRSKISYG